MRRFVSRLIVIAALSLAIGAAVTVTVGLRNARADPVVRRELAEDLTARTLAAFGVGLGLHDAAELDLEFAGQVEGVVRALDDRLEEEGER